MTLAYVEIDSPVGRLLLAGDGDQLHVLAFREGKKAREAHPDWIEDGVPLRAAVEQLRAYFAGELQDFTLALAPSGTSFQLRVWKELTRIPYGATICYGELANRIGNPNASRAVGLANGCNPIAIIVPCHRVIGASGKLTGYGGGLPIKDHLLALERRSSGLFAAQAISSVY
ncbi:MAG TPA: methylated-DNA--[protein]-cysteine S-methyltransferase [Bryobacteraceae bacterium]|nr:methylated-DNA--[protein]-cysteine S-methyltransferase [Bryobacteraceae bacterium]